jgi:transcription termination/antitermination protein NusA
MSVISHNDVLESVIQIAKERRIDLETVFETLEMALQQDAIQTYGADKNITVHVDRTTGKIALGRNRTIVDHITNSATDVLLSQVQKVQPQKKLGDLWFEELSFDRARRSNAKNVKRLLSQKIRSIELHRQYEEFIDRVGSTMSGMVKRLEFGHVILELSGAEALLRKDQMIPKERFKIGDRVKIYIEKVVHSEKSPQIITSRTHSQFLACLMTHEVPEIYDGLIEIKAVVRDPGSRAKIAVYSKDDRIPAIGACVGVRGVRIEAVKAELKGEKIDIVQWSSDLPTLIANALTPIEVLKVVMDPLSHRVEVVVPNEKQNLAIGRGGQNIRLVSQLTETSIDILTQEQEAEKRSRELSECVTLFTQYLDLDDLMARFLAMEGFETLDDIVDADLEELASLNGMNEEIAQELKKRAEEAQPLYRQDLYKKLAEEGVDSHLLSLDLPVLLLKKLPLKGIYTLDEFAGLARDELQEMVPDAGLLDDQVDAIIIQARQKAFGNLDAMLASNMPEGDSQITAPKTFQASDMDLDLGETENTSNNTPKNPPQESPQN